MLAAAGARSRRRAGVVLVGRASGPQLRPVARCGAHPDIGLVTFPDAAAQAELVVNATARGVEMRLPLWLRVMGALGTPQFNMKVVR